MHFRNHEEYMRFIRSTPTEPHEYVEPKDDELGEEGKEDGEVLQAD